MNIKEVSRVKLKKLVLNNYSSLPDQLLKEIFAPVHLVVEPQAGCNVQCVACPSTELKRPYGQMKYTDFMKIIEKIPNIKQIAFFFMGEPFLNQETYKMIKLCSQIGITSIVNTNCTTLKKDYKKIIDCGLTKLNLSLDGFSDDSINAYRKGTNFKEIVEGIENLMNYREKTKSGIQIFMRTLVFKQTEPEIPMIEKFAQKVGIDELVLVTPILDGWGGKTNQHKNEIKPSEKWLRVSETRPKPPTPCPSVRKLVITWDGMILPCCHDVHGKYSYGNIFDDSMDESYWSVEGRRLRESVVKCDLSICWGCERVQPEEKKVVLYTRASSEERK